MKPFALAIALVGSSILLGCSTTRTEAQRETAEGDARTRGVVQNLQGTMRTPPLLVERVDRAYIGRRANVVARDQALPAVMRQEVAMIFDDGRPTNALGEVSIPISTLAERLTRATGVPTRVKTDVYLPLSALVPGRAQPIASTFASQVSAGAQAATAGPAAAQRVPEIVRSTAPITSAESVTVSLPARLVAPVSQILDLVKARVGINARYAEDGYLEFYRLSTRTFQIAALPGDQNYTTQLGQTSQGGANFTANANVTTTATLRPFSSAVIAVRAMLTQAGTAVENEATRTITVTDTDDVLSAVAGFVGEENRLLRRQIAVEIRTVSFRSNRTNDLSFDWQALYTAILERYGYRVTIGGPATGAPENAGVIGVVAIPGRTAEGRFNNSSAFVNALEELGDTKTERSNILYTTSGRSVAYAVTRTFDYVFQTTSSAASLTAVSTGIQTKQDTVGRILSLLPVMVSENSVAVDVMINESQLLSLTPQTSGQGIAQQTVQLVDKIAEQSRHSLLLRDGDELVFAGLSQSDDSNTRRSLAESISPIAGGSVGAQRTVTRSFLVMKVRVYDTL